MRSGDVTFHADHCPCPPPLLLRSCLISSLSSSRSSGSVGVPLEEGMLRAWYAWRCSWGLGNRGFLDLTTRALQDMESISGYEAKVAPW